MLNVQAQLEQVTCHACMCVLACDGGGDAGSEEKNNWIMNGGKDGCHRSSSVLPTS